MKTEKKERCERMKDMAEDEAAKLAECGEALVKLMNEYGKTRMETAFLMLRMKEQEDLR